MNSRGEEVPLPHLRTAERESAVINSGSPLPWLFSQKAREPEVEEDELLLIEAPAKVLRLDIAVDSLEAVQGSKCQKELLIK